MKETYQSPELNLISYVPCENLASFDFDDLLDGKGGQSTEDVTSREPALDF